MIKLAFLITYFRDFQTSLDHLSASWDFSGEPCPIAEYEWMAYRIDGKEYQPWINVGSRFYSFLTVSILTVQGDGNSYFECESGSIHDVNFYLRRVVLITVVRIKETLESSMLYG